MLRVLSRKFYSAFAVVLLLLLTQQVIFTQEPVTIRFASFQSGPVVELWEQQFAEFEAETGIRVEMEYIPADETVERYLTLAASNDLPDVAMVSARFLRSLATRNLLEELSQDQFENLDLEDFWPNLLAAYSYDGVQYGLPTDLDLQLVFYNKTLFDDTGVNYPEEGWTWDDYRAIAAQLASGEGAERVYGSMDFSLGQTRMIAWSYGGDLVNEDGAPAFDSEPVQNALSFVQGITVEDQAAVVPGTQGVGIENGQVGMGIFGPWAAWYIMRDADFEWDVVPVPQGTEQSVLAWGSALASFNGTEHPEEVRKFMEFFLAPERQFQRAADWAWFPSAKSATEVEGFMDESVLALTEAQKQYIIDSTAYGRAPLIQRDEAQLEDIFNQELSLMTSGSQSLEQTLENLQNRWGDVLR